MLILTWLNLFSFDLVSSYTVRILPPVITAATTSSCFSVNWLLLLSFKTLTKYLNKVKCVKRIWERFLSFFHVKSCSSFFFSVFLISSVWNLSENGRSQKCFSESDRWKHANSNRSDYLCPGVRVRAAAPMMMKPSHVLQSAGFCCCSLNSESAVSSSCLQRTHECTDNRHWIRYWRFFLPLASVFHASPHRTELLLSHYLIQLINQSVTRCLLTRNEKLRLFPLLFEKWSQVSLQEVLQVTWTSFRLELC